MVGTTLSDSFLVATAPKRVNFSCSLTLYYINHCAVQRHTGAAHYTLDAWRVITFDTAESHMDAQSDWMLFTRDVAPNAARQPTNLV